MTCNSICVLGGGGFVGSHLISLLAARGYRVVVPTRRRARIKHLLVLPSVEVVEADIHDPAALQSLFTGMDAVINLVGILHESRPDAFQQAHVELPRKIIAACMASGTRRLLHMSALGADATSKSRYQQSKSAGEALVREARDLNTTVFRPSVIFGPGDSFLTLFAGLLKLAPVVPLADASARFQPVFVGDVARAFADALALPETFGQCHDLCGPSVYTLAELVNLTAATLGPRRRILPLSATASYWFARLMELKPGTKIMTRDNHYAMLTDNVCQDSCAQPFGTPTALESVIGYLKEADPRRDYMGFRTHAGR
ncbi:MAG: complex I NDUFA9 subunit family protein [Gallionellaceae bacterium]|nr:complex I NDUFA9 subunit family protein [Gallionellaceae bacterium]